MKFYLLSLFLFFIANPLSAEPTSDPIPFETTGTGKLEDMDHWLHQAEKEPQNFQGKFLHMLLILGLMIAFMYFASWALKRMMKARVNTLNEGNEILLIESRFLSTRLTLHLVEVEGKKLLIAEAPTSACCLSILTDQTPQKIHEKIIQDL